MGGPKYIVATTSEGSVALIMESGGKRILPPTGVQQGGPRGSVEAMASAMSQSKGKVWCTLRLDTPTPFAGQVAREYLLDIMKRRLAAQRRGVAGRTMGALHQARLRHHGRREANHQPAHERTQGTGCIYSAGGGPTRLSSSGVTPASCHSRTSCVWTT